MGIDPVTLGVAALAVSVLGTGMSVYVQAQQANAANAQAEYQSQVAANNAKTAEMEAQYAEQQGERNAEAQRRKTAIMIGAQRARMGASGVVADTGSFLDLSLDTAKMGELDAMALQEEGELAAWRARAQGTNYRAQSTLYGASKTSPWASATGTLLSGLGHAGMGYYSMTKGVVGGERRGAVLGPSPSVFRTEPGKALGASYAPDTPVSAAIRQAPC